MTQSAESLESVVEDLESKAEQYETATNYEEKKQRYLNNLSSVENSLSRLNQHLQSMEFLAAVLTEVHGERLPTGGQVESARQGARSTVDRDIDDFYDLVNERRTDQYEQEIQQTISRVSSAREAVEADLRDVENEWKERVESARNVQKLVGESRKMSQTLSDIEKFVKRRMWEDSNQIQALKYTWDELYEQWKEGDVDWDTFQREYELSDDTMAVLKELASERQIKFGTITDDVAKEMLSVGPLRNVITLNI